MMSNTTFVAAAFTVTWAALIGYLVHLRRQVRQARAALEQATRAGAR
jgi:CcmD family protein